MPAVKRTTVITVILAGVLAFAAVAAADIIELKVNLSNATCTTTSSNQLHCSGDLTGLGSQTADVTVISGFGCTNQGGNNPPGQVQIDVTQVFSNRTKTSSFCVPIT